MQCHAILSLISLSALPGWKRHTIRVYACDKSRRQNYCKSCEHGNARTYSCVVITDAGVGELHTCHHETTPGSKLASRLRQTGATDHNIRPYMFIFYHIFLIECFICSPAPFFQPLVHPLCGNSQHHTPPPLPLSPTHYTSGRDKGVLAQVSGFLSRWHLSRPGHLHRFHPEAAAPDNKLWWWECWRWRAVYIHEGKTVFEIAFFGGSLLSLGFRV